MKRADSCAPETWYVVQTKWIGEFRAREYAPRRLFACGEPVVITQGPFAGLEGIYEMSDGDERGLLMLELPGRSAKRSSRREGCWRRWERPLKSGHGAAIGKRRVIQAR